MVQMKFSFRLILSFLLFLFILLSIPKTKAVNAGPFRPNNLSKAKLEFKTRIAVSDIIVLHKKYKLTQSIIEGDFSYKGQQIHDFLIIDDTNLNKDVVSDYVAKRKSFLNDTKLAGKTFSPSDLNDISNISISKVTITGATDDIPKIKNELGGATNNINSVLGKGNSVGNISAIQSVDLDNPDWGAKDKFSPKQLPDPTTRKNNQLAAPLADVSDNTIPKSGISIFGQSSSTEKYVQQNMRWPVINFSSEQTYEHDIFLYNYDRKTYLDGGSTSFPNCYPKTTYAATSWPAESKPYLDTRLAENLTSCEIDELAYTIGAAQANALKANTDYYTYIRTANGNDYSDRFKLQAQIGHRTPTICYTTWCSFGDKSYVLIPAWSSTVPGTQSWTYGQTVPNAPNNVSVTNPTNNSLQMNFTDNSTNETDIQIERKTGTNGSWGSQGGFGALNGAGNWYWVNTGLSPNTTYCYRLKAVNNIGSSAYSNEACGTTTGVSQRSEVVTDDTSGDFSKGGSYWQQANIGYNSHMFWTYVNGNNVDSWGEWQANLAGGNYEIFVFIPNNYATTTSAKYIVYYNGGNTTKSVSQNSYYNAWVSLGTYNFTSGASRRLRLTDATGETNYSLRVAFDAVKFTPR